MNSRPVGSSGIDLRILASLLIAATAALAGCAGMNKSYSAINTSLNQAMGTYIAPTLAGSPRSSGCTDERCRSLDEFERVAYEKARKKEIRWVHLVDAFYEARRRLYPNSADDSLVYEYQSFQRALAEQVDAGRVTESQWAYLVDRKFNELSERRRTGYTQCNTTNIGSQQFPNYQTICR